MVTIPLKHWLKWSPDERAQVIKYYEDIGEKWMLDLTAADLDVRDEVQKDYQDEADAQGVTVSKLLK